MRGALSLLEMMTAFELAGTVKGVSGLGLPTVTMGMFYLSIGSRLALTFWSAINH